ncbi:hypothetical protein E3N88_23547 [Mikania micrantha]|uniref:Uncharacterized protein n=1 Tax=Mikania micrantha TaxID=192012 RepID=A0A5N6NDK1_9ASTR|nr:hypothetical protein E3N88_23547 [Mikania micrantha]
MRGKIVISSPSSSIFTQVTLSPESGEPQPPATRFQHETDPNRTPIDPIHRFSQTFSGNQLLPPSVSRKFGFDSILDSGYELLRPIKYTQHKKITTMEVFNPLIAVKSKKHHNRQPAAMPEVVRISMTDPDVEESLGKAVNRVDWGPIWAGFVLESCRRRLRFVGFRREGDMREYGRRRG